MLKGEVVRDYQARIQNVWMQMAIIWSNEGDATGREASEYTLYWLAYTGLHPWIKKAINPVMPTDTKQFASLNELFERAA